jgi:hypothetical protein
MLRLAGNAEVTKCGAVSTDQMTDAIIAQL